MENKQQTAVIWLQQGLETILTYEQQMQAIGLFVQAADMEKEQIKEAYNEGYRNGEHDAEGNDFIKMDISKFGNSENYYNETYGE